MKAKKKLTIALMAIFFVVAVALGIHLTHKQALANTPFLVHCIYVVDGSSMDGLTLTLRAYNGAGNQIGEWEMIPTGGGSGEYTKVIADPPGVRWDVWFDQDDFHYMGFDPSGPPPCPKMLIVVGGPNNLTWRLCDIDR